MGTELVMATELPPSPFQASGSGMDAAGNLELL
jgi:hypothetical protein